MQIHPTPCNELQNLLVEEQPLLAQAQELELLAQAQELESLAQARVLESLAQAEVLGKGGYLLS
jgi:hypothetical protein